MRCMRSSIVATICAVAAGLLSAVPAAAGPDVIVSDIFNNSGSSFFRRYGTVGGITGYAFGTVSCNVGDQEAIWIDCTTGQRNCNQHPVIAQNLYRIRQVNGATQFDQIGMSWLKHGFCAADAQGANCGTCQNAGTCDWLGLGCTDTYSAGLNGSQPRLGPRSEVNAYTGLYEYPYLLNWAQTGDAVFKRLQVHNTYLDPALNSSGIYIGESHYVTTDEFRAGGVDVNNASWRQVVVGPFDGTAWDIGFTGSTMQQQTAIEAWQQLDPGVTVVDVFVPAEGRFVFAGKVTDLGGGQWHYEYAAYNMNSSRSGQSFSVPTGAAVLSNIAFHSVDYHSGEPYTNLDWTVINSGGVLTWETETEAQNPNANALRWGTTYSFRFDADTPPTSGTATLGLFKSGTPSSISENASVPSPCPGAPDGDINLDSFTDGADVERFVDALISDPTNVIAVCRGDFSTDGTVDPADLPGFVAALLAP